jgi:hypothetical protein
MNRNITPDSKIKEEFREIDRGRIAAYLPGHTELEAELFDRSCSEASAR